MRIRTRLTLIYTVIIALILLFLNLYIFYFTKISIKKDFFDKLDVLGGYLRSSDDWQDAQGGKTTRFTSNGYRAEADYYVQRGFAVMARYDRMKQTIAGGPANHTNAWNIGTSKALTEMGNVVLRATYGPAMFGLTALATVAGGRVTVEPR